MCTTGLMSTNRSCRTCWLQVKKLPCQLATLLWLESSDYNTVACFEPIKNWLVATIVDVNVDMFGIGDLGPVEV